MLEEKHFKHVNSLVGGFCYSYDGNSERECVDGFVCGSRHFEEDAHNVSDQFRVQVEFHKDFPRHLSVHHLFEEALIFTL